MSFDVARTSTRTRGETVITEELIRVKLQGRRTAEVTRREPGSPTERKIRSQPLRHRLVTIR
jgi:hypothetical protein